MTMPRVPRIERPPIMPRRGFMVLRAIASPSGNGDLDHRIGGHAKHLRFLLGSPARSWRRGTGLIAGSPGGSGRPGSVTVPTPSPARQAIPAPGALPVTFAMISAPWGGIRIVTGILDDARARESLAAIMHGERERHPVTARQRNRHRIGEITAMQCMEGSPGSCGGAASRGPSTTQFGLRACFPPSNAL